MMVMVMMMMMKKTYERIQVDVCEGTGTNQYTVSYLPTALPTVRNHNTSALVTVYQLNRKAMQPDIQVFGGNTYFPTKSLADSILQGIFNTPFSSTSC